MPWSAEARRDRRDELVHGQRRPTGDRRRLGRRAVEIELPLGGRRVDRHRERRVPLHEVDQVVAGLGRVEQVGGDRRVELQVGEVDAGGEQRAHQRLRVVAAQRRRRQRGDHGRVEQLLGGDPGDRRRGAVGHDGHAGQRAAPRFAVPRRRQVERRERGEQLGAGCRRLALDDLRLERLALVGGQHHGCRTQRLGHPLGERAELEEVEQPLHLGHVRFHLQRLGQLDRGVAAQDHHVVVLAHPLLVLGQRGPQLGRQLVEVLEDAVQPAVGVDQLGRRLLPHPGTPGRLSLGSPRSAAYWAYSPGVTPVRSLIPASS